MSNLTTKRCSKCGKEYPCTNEFWHKDKTKKTGFSSTCKECAINRSMNHYHDNRDEIREKAKQYRKDNSEAIKISKHDYSMRTRDAKREYDKIYNTNNRDKRIAQSKEYYSKNKAKISEYNKEYRKRNADIMSSKRRKYYEANKEIVQARNKKNYDRIAQRMRGKVYIHKKRANGGSFTKEQIQLLYEAQGHRCMYCGIDIRDSYCIEHHLPVSLGGTSDITNIVLSCKSCNSSKRDKHPFKWFRLKQYA